MVEAKHQHELGAQMPCDCKERSSAAHTRGSESLLMAQNLVLVLLLAQAKGSWPSLEEPWLLDGGS